MTNREWRYALVLVAAVALAVAVPWLRPAPVDWSDSFERDDARPYGSRVLFESLPALFPQADTVRAVPTTPYLWLRDRRVQRSAYMFVTNELRLDPTETRAVLDHVARGNVVFAAAHQFGGPFADSLHLETGMDLDVETVRAQITDSVAARLRLSAVNLRRPTGYPVRSQAARYTFRAVDTARTAVLGTTADGGPTLIRTKWGGGTLVLSTTPRVFTNYHILNADSRAYVWAAISSVPADRRSIWWDTRHKPRSARTQTVMRFVLSSPSLRMAYWLLLGGVVLFVITRGRRRQRPIPVVQPPRNRMLEFVRQVGRLYYDRGQPMDLAQKKIEHFEIELRRRDLPSDPLGADWVDQVARQTNVPRADVLAVADMIATVRTQSSLSTKQLHRLDASLDTFYDHVRS